MTLISQAAAFAAKAHEGMLRKGTDIPYITHPMEAAQIVASITSDPHVIAAAMLHDVMEDCGVMREELCERFGERVAQLVAAETQIRDGDPCDTWECRKRATIAHITSCGRDEKIIALGDKLSNMRAICRDYEQNGDAMFCRFHQRDKRRHAWYYRSCAEGLRGELGKTPAFCELERLIRRVFGDAPDLAEMAV